MIDKPFPTLLPEELGLGALNLALGGASASAYADEDALIEYINSGKILIVTMENFVVDAPLCANVDADTHAVLASKI